VINAGGSVRFSVAQAALGVIGADIVIVWFMSKK